MRADELLEVTADPSRVVHGAGVVARTWLPRDTSLFDPLAPLCKARDVAHLRVIVQRSRAHARARRTWPRGKARCAAYARAVLGSRRAASTRV